jgi:hypothetical protein
MMKQLVSILAVAVLAFGIAGCGNDKTKEKLVGTEVITSSSVSGDTPPPVILPANRTESTAGMAKQSGNMAAGAITEGLTPVPFGNDTITLLAPRMTDEAAARKISLLPDAEGYFDFSDYYPSLKLKFMDASQAPYSYIYVYSDWLGVRFNRDYAYGVFSGDFLCHRSVMPKVISGTITALDPLGGTFSATLSNITYEELPGDKGVPVSGSMTLMNGSSGYIGTFTFGKSGSSYVCTGAVTYQSAQMATVSLTFDAGQLTYAGSFTDDTGVHQIQ